MIAKIAEVAGYVILGVILWVTLVAALLAIYDWLRAKRGGGVK